MNNTPAPFGSLGRITSNVSAMPALWPYTTSGVILYFVIRTCRGNSHEIEKAQEQDSNVAAIHWKLPSGDGIGVGDRVNRF